MNCYNCNGIGTIKLPHSKNKVRECVDCKGTGQAVYMPSRQMCAGDMHCVVNGVRYGSKIELPYRNTAGNKAVCIVDGYEVAVSFMQHTNQYPLYHYPLKDVLFTGIDALTGANVCRPLWRSITLQKKTELFEQNIAERI